MNQLQLYIENLGAIKQAELTINPLTVLAGENGTGKSFVTKFLYSVLNILQKDLYRERIYNFTRNLIERLTFLLDNFMDDEKIKIIILKLEDINKRTLKENNGYYNFDYIEIDEIFLMYKELLDKIKENISIEKEKYFFGKKQFYSIDVIEEKFTFDVLDIFEQLSFAFKDPDLYYKRDLFIPSLLNELRLNFQIPDIDLLIRNGENRFVFYIKDIMKINYDRDEGLLVEWLNKSLKTNSIVFLESPVYWRELALFRQIPKTNFYIAKSMNKEYFTGVPKYFFDLRDLVFLDFVNNERYDFIKECMDILKKSLKGNFNIGHEDLYFEDEFGYSINKNLVSFGMTNLGIIQLLLSKNIINRGSFIFIDEPESNLHPAWQAVLANILVKLAKHGVYIIMTTHSSDVLKALDVINQEHQQSEDFISVHYFEKTGYLLALNQSEHSYIQQARLKLLETYDDLVLRGYLV